MFFIDPKTDVNANVPNLGLAYAATHHKVKVVDQHVLPYPADRFLGIKAETVGVSIKSFTAAEAERIKRVYSKKYPGSKVVSLTGFLDVQCCYPYVAWDGGIEHAEPFSDNYPFPEYELFDSFRYLRANWETGFWAYPVMTSQGCPYSCLFCASRNRKWMARSAQNCADELKNAKEKYGIKSFDVIDDAFNIDRKRVIEFCELIRPLGLRWACTNGIRADRFDEDTARAMKAAGCYHVGFGVESSDPGILEAIKKGETIGQIEDAVVSAKRHIPMVSGFFVIGLPGSTYEKDLASLEWAKKLGIRAHFSYFVPEMPAKNTGKTFYGPDSGPGSEPYSRERQVKIYKMSKELRKKFYSGENILPKIAVFTVRGLPKYGLNGILTHTVHLFKRGWTYLTKGELP